MKTIWNKGVEHFGTIFRRALKDWLLILIASLVLAYLGFILFFTNPYQFYVPSKLTQSLVSIPFIFLGLSYLVGLFRQLQLDQITRKSWIGLILWSLAVAVAVLFLFPNPRPLLSQNHQLKIIASGEKNRFATDSIIEVRQVKSLDGKLIPLDKFQVSGDWEYTAGELYSHQGGLNSIAVLSGSFAGGVSINLRYLSEAGKVTIQWDQNQQSIDLYTSSAPTIEEFIFDGFRWNQLSWLQAGLVGLSDIAYFLGIFFVVLICSLFIRSKILPNRAGKVLLVLAYFTIFIWFVNQKISYTSFTGNRPYQDSRSYVQTADFPLNSTTFWAGERSFTFPLLLKILDVHFADSWGNQKMEEVELVHICLSIASWGLLALLVSLKIRQNWLKPLAFACILAFSLNLEIGIWDSLMLSESLSISLFALLIATFMGVQFLSGHPQRPWVQWTFLGSWALVALLYSFVRDSNQYFLLVAAGIYLIRILLKYKQDLIKRVSVYFIVVVLVIIGVQSISISVGNRWQIFIYDHLAMRILPDAQATAFFSAHGLPISDALMSTVGMNAKAYQTLMEKDPAMQPVRDWVNQSGKTTYLLYLLNQLGDSLLEPIQQVSSLVDGQILAYEYPTYYSHPYPKELKELSDVFYFRSSVLEWIAGIGLLAAAIAWAIKGRANSIWFVIAILSVSIYPMMFIVWHGEPLEIERHALQIGIQFRLVAWMALLTIIDLLTMRVLSPHLDLAPQPKGGSYAEI